MSERRFTDQEVALILRRVAELEGESTPETARGLSLRQLQEIAAEVGIDAGLVARAAAEIQSRGRLSEWSPFGASPANRQIRAVPTELAEDALRQLIALVDERVPAQGTVTEALGGVRWSSSNRLLHRQVTLQPASSETVIRVDERYEESTRRMAHLMPAVYGAAAGAVIGAEVVGGVAAAIALALVFTAALWVLAGTIWNKVADRSHDRTAALADELSAEAERLALASGESRGR